MKKLSAKCINALEEFRAELDDACDAAREYYDNKSEKWQASEIGENYGTWVDELEALYSELEAVRESPDGH